MIHSNINVANLAKSLEFYDKALGLKEMRRSVNDRFTLAFLGDDTSDFRLELTELKDHPQPYDLGENEIHLAFKSEDFMAGYELHKSMGCICQDTNGGFYFIEDPDGYWLEICK